MSSTSPMNIPKAGLTDGYEIEFYNYNLTTHAKIITDGGVGFHSRIIILDDVAVV